jgi:hypothetical protein
MSTYLVLFYAYVIGWHMLGFSCNITRFFFFWLEKKKTQQQSIWIFLSFRGIEVEEEEGEKKSEHLPICLCRVIINQILKVVFFETLFSFFFFFFFFFFLLSTYLFSSDETTEKKNRKSIKKGVIGWIEHIRHLRDIMILSTTYFIVTFKHWHYILCRVRKGKNLEILWCLRKQIINQHQHLQLPCLSNLLVNWKELLNVSN